MAWPAEAGSLGVIHNRLPVRARRRPRSRVAAAPIAWEYEYTTPLAYLISGRPHRHPHRRGRIRPGSRVRFAAGRGKYFVDGRGKYRVFNAATYRFYRSSTGPPAETDTPFATNASLPHEPADVFGDATWWVSVSYFNGVIDSGFLPLGPGAETYLRLDVAGGVEVGSPPRGPLDCRLGLVAAGVVRVLAVSCESGSLKPDTWAIAYTTNGSEPPADTPDVTQDMTASPTQVLEYDLPGQGDGTTVKVRVQTRRAGIYSENSTVLSIDADAAGPTAPPAGE